MEKDENGYFRVTVPNLPVGSRYFYRINEESDVPDPVSCFQPEGVHGPSEVIDRQFAWNDWEWFGRPLKDYVIYELHVGTFTAEGTFDAIIPRLSELKELGVTALEIMPVAQFPGERNWGYDGVGLFAVQNSYGGPAGLKRLVNAAHQHGLAVVLDVVYNHLGPEGNYLGMLAPYFTDTYKTPWGLALNFDGAHSREVRRFFLANALYWQTECHIDALRLDAVHAIRDQSATPFLLDLSRVTKAQADRLNRRFYLIAESDLNAPRFILPETLGGYGLDAQWADDFHHCLHVLLTGERRGYYEDYAGGVDQFAKVWREGYAYTGEYSAFRKATHGAVPRNTSLRQFVVCAQNHDQIGNRMTGDRLSASLDLPSLKLAAAAVLLSPFTPLLYMGEEYGEPAPFQYFTSHTDPGLVEAVIKGRSEEFSSFAWQGEVPNPQSEETFQRSKLNWKLSKKGTHAELREFYRKVLRLRKTWPHFTAAERHNIEVRTIGQVLAVTFSLPEVRRLKLVMNFGRSAEELPAQGKWSVLLDSHANDGSSSRQLADSIQVQPNSALLLKQDH